MVPAASRQRKRKHSVMVGVVGVGTTITAARVHWCAVEGATSWWQIQTPRVRVRAKEWREGTDWLVELVALTLVI